VLEFIIKLIKYIDLFKIENAGIAFCEEAIRLANNITSLHFGNQGDYGKYI
jgi:hypothetical protein